LQSAQYCFIETLQCRTPAERAGKRGETRAPWRRIAIVQVVLAMVPGLLLPSASAGSNAVIWVDDDQAVMLAPQDEETAPLNDHPVNLAPQAVEEMLASLRLRYPDQETETPPLAVFNKDQANILGKALATGLARAEASQDVTFSIVGAHRLSPGAFARRNRLTAGRAFFREGRLNLIFGELQSPYRKKNIYGRIDEDFHPRKYGRRAAAEEHEAALIATTSASLQSAPEGPRDDWVLFQPGLAGADRAPQPEATAAPGESATLPPASGRAAEPPPAATVNDVPASREDAAEADPRPAAVDTTDIEQRLETLKRLREKELISEEAYRQKVDEILGDL
jgi:hypothetical protein